MLKMIDETLDEVLAIPSTPINQETININKLLNCMERNVPLNAGKIMMKLNIKSKNTLRNQYLHPAIKQGLGFYLGGIYNAKSFRNKFM